MVGRWRESYRDGHRNTTRAYLCCVLAKQGELPSARESFLAVQEYLVATDQEDLLAECLALIGT